MNLNHPVSSGTVQVIKNWLKSVVPFLVLLTGLLLIQSQVVFAGPLDVLNDLEDKIEISNYESTTHADASDRPGVSNITSAIFFVIDLIKWTLGSIAVLMLIINAIRLITAGKESEDAVSKEKNFLKYALMGLVLVFVSEEAVRLAFFGNEGEVLRNQDSAQDFAQAGSDVISGIYSFVEIFMGSIAVLMLVFSGIQILVAAGSEDAVEKSKKRIYISAIGLLIIGISELVIRDIIFVDQGSGIDVDRGRELIVSITNFISSVIGVVSVLAFVYAGFLYIVNFGNDDFTSKAKKIMFGAVAGIVIAAAAFAIVSTVIPVAGAQ